MKHILLFPFCLLFFITASAQTFEVVDPVFLVEGNASDLELDVHWGIHNLSSEAKTVRVSRTLIQMESGAEDRFCWGPICYPVNTAESSDSDNLLVTIEADSVNNSFIGYYEPEGTSGYGVIEYCFFDHFNFSDEICNTVTYCTLENDCAVGVIENKMSVSLGDIGPNPLSANSAFSYQLNGKAQNASIHFYNMIGEQIREINLNTPQGIVYLSSDDFENGVYFYALSAQGTVYATKKFVVSK
jgi:hypothetical protein